MFLQLMFALLLTGGAEKQAPRPSQVAARAQADLSTYLTADDYPLEAIRNEQQGTVRFRLSIDAKGGVSDCVIIASSGSETLDTTTCRLMSERARFTPARDARGRPTADVATARIIWKLPDLDAPPDYVAFGTFIDAEGQASECYSMEGDSQAQAVRAAQRCGEGNTALFLNARSLSKQAKSEVRAEQIVLRDSSERVPEPLKDLIVSRVVYSATTDADGKLSQCEVIEKRGYYLPSPEPGCGGGAAKIYPDEKGRTKVRIAATLYLVGEGRD